VSKLCTRLVVSTFEGLQLRPIIRRNVIAISALLGSLFWFIDGLLDYFFFFEGSLVGILFTNVPPHELYIRLVWFFGLLLIGVFSTRIIEEREEALKEKQDLEELLRSVRNVNQLLVKGKEREDLIQETCEILYKTKGLKHVWIALFDDSEELIAASQSGLEEKFEPIRKKLRSGTFPKRIRRAMDESSTLITRGSEGISEDWPLADECREATTVTHRLEHNSKVYGIISACLPEKVTDEELGLLDEVAGDIAFGLYNKDVEEKRKRAVEKLARSRKQFRRAVQLAPFPMMIHAEDGEVFALNDRWENISGYGEEEISTISDWTKRAYGEERNNVREHINELYELDRRIDEGEYELTTKDGSKRIWDFSSAPIGRSDDGRRLVLSIAHDVTERKRIEQKVEKERDRAQRYLNIAGSIIVLVDKESKVKEINKKGCEILGYEKDEVIGKNWFDNFIPEKVRETIIEESRKPLMEGAIEEAEYYENSILTKDGEERIIAWENTPIRENGQIVGTLSSGIDITERKKMEELLQEEHDRIEDSFVQLAETTSRVLGVRDPYTEAHEQRVAELAKEVGSRMGLDEEKLLGLYIGGVLHDIGKIAIPETILTKPGELKDVEWDMIKSHPEVGYNQILEDTDFPWPVAEMTLHHHERLDGSGYPDGLEEEELTTEVRILGAVDVVEAMSTRRPYRKARTKDRTLGVLEDEKTTKFDPEVVGILVDMIKKGIIQFGGK